MIRWRDRLEIRILLLAIVLPLLGAFAISFGVMLHLRASLIEVAREHSGSTAEMITRSIEKIMLSGKADLTRNVVEELRATSSVEQVELINGEGKEAFSGAVLKGEPEAMARLAKRKEPFSERRGDQLVFYRPLVNGSECRECHAGQGALLGATKVTVSLEGTLGQGTSLVVSAFLWSILGVLSMGGLFWLVIRRMVVVPVASIQQAVHLLSQGDFSGDARVTSRDEVGTLWSDLKASLGTLSGVISRINRVSERVASVSEKVEQESSEVVLSTGVEADSFEGIAASMEEFNASIREMADSLEGLAGASESAHGSSRELSSATAEITKRTNDLSEAVGDVSSTAGEMFHTIRELSWGAEHLSDVSKQTLSALQGLEAYVRAVEGDAAEAFDLSRKVRHDAEELGMKSIERTIGGMDDLFQAVKETSASIDALGARSRQIGEIVDVIDEINDQTSLLALNAAILAAQAGENGKGFQVVAGEIRKLATGTAKSTVEIGGLVKNFRSEVEKAVSAMHVGMKKAESGSAFAREAGSALRTIVESAGSSMEKASAIRDSSTGQTGNLDKVKEATQTLDQMVQFLAQGTTEQKREAEGISRAVEQILDAANQIKAATEHQLEATRSIERSIEGVSNVTLQMSRGLRDEKEGSSQVMEALGKVVDLPARTRQLAIQINHGLRRILADTDLLRTEVQGFKVLGDGGRDVIRLGVVPLESPAEMHNRFSGLADYLGRTLGKPVELHVALDFAEAVEDLGRGRTQIAYLTPSTYVEARERYGARLLVKALRNGKPYQHSVIVTTARSGIRTIEDLRGRSFAFGDAHSTSSYIVPRAMLKEKGVLLEHLGRHDHLDRHDAVARAVLKGEYDAGALMQSVAFKHRGDGLVVVATSPEIPEFNFCAAAAFPEEEALAIGRALKDLSPGGGEGGEVLRALYSDYTGFADARDADYEGIRAMMRSLGLIEQEEAPVLQASGH